MGMHIDAAGHHILAFCVNDAGRVLAREPLAKGRDLAIRDGYIGRISIGSGNHNSIGNESVKSHWSSLCDSTSALRVALASFAPFASFAVNKLSTMYCSCATIAEYLVPLVIVGKESYVECVSY